MFRKAHGHAYATNIQGAVREFCRGFIAHSWFNGISARYRHRPFGMPLLGRRLLKRRRSV